MATPYFVLFHFVRGPKLRQLKKKIILYEHEKIAETFNMFSGDIKKLNILINSEVLEDVSMTKHSIIDGIEKYKQHPSILKIKKQITIGNYFYFKYID